MLPATASIISIIQMLSVKQQKQILFRIKSKESSFLYLFLGGEVAKLTTSSVWLFSNKASVKNT